MASHRFKIYKGVASKIFVTIKNSDKRVIPAAGKVFTAYVISNASDELKLERQLDEIDAAAGQWELLILAGEADSWERGSYLLVITILDENQNEYNLYGDLNYGVINELWVEDAMPVLKPATVSTGSEWQQRINKYYSSAYPGDAQEGRHDGLHTIAIYSTDFTGQFWVQASLENTAPNLDTDWFDLNIGGITDYIDIVDSDTLQTLNFITNAQWIRFVYDPDDANVGTIDQVLYRV